jgi:Flp pilus assembly protein TadD/SAM-dependent methyltransferase
MSDFAARLDAALKRHRGGDLAGAMAAYRAILVEAPDEPEALHLLGVATLQWGDAAAAAGLIERAIAAAPQAAKYHVNLGEARRQLGQLEDAIACYRRAIALDPANAAARNNLGAVLLRLGRTDAAREALEAAAHDDPQAQANLGQALWRHGEILPALQALANATLLAPQHLGYRQLLLRVARDMPKLDLPPMVWKQLFDCFGVSGVDVQPISRAVLAMARRTKEFGEVAALAALPIEGARRALGDGTGGDLLNSLLLNDVLFHTLIADPTVEALLVRLRRILLADAMDEVRSPDSGLLGAQPLFAAGLAAQAYMNGYLWPAEPAERADIQHLADRLAQDAILGRLSAGDSAAMQRFMLVAAYRPLAGPGAEGLQGVAGVIELASDRFAPRLRALVKRQIGGAKAEAEALRSLQGLASGTEVSGARWQAFNRLPPVPLAERLGALFPDLAFRPSTARALVAGCGMGKATIELALQLADTRVTAIDPRHADLAYAQSMARLHGVPRITFRPGSPADLAADDRFDLIDAAAPVDQLAPLAHAVAAGGLLKLVLPSMRRAAAIRAAQDHVAFAGYGARDLDAARRALLALPPDHPAREVAGWDAFYARPSATELLFGAPQPGFDLAAARAAIGAAGLEWLGLQRDERIVAEPATSDLTLQVWARKAA